MLSIMLFFAGLTVIAIIGLKVWVSVNSKGFIVRAGGTDKKTAPYSYGVKRKLRKKGIDFQDNEIVALVDGNSMKPKNIDSGDVVIAQRFEQNSELTPSTILVIRYGEKGECLKLREFSSCVEDKEGVIRTITYTKDAIPRETTHEIKNIVGVVDRVVKPIRTAVEV